MTASTIEDVLTTAQREGHLGKAPITTHLDHGRAHLSAAMARHDEHWCDLGSGGGVPGLVMAAELPGLRREAAQNGLDPNVWHDNVEILAAREIGRETVQYVDNIYKYYLSFVRIEQQREKRARRAGE